MHKDGGNTTAAARPAAGVQAWRPDAPARLTSLTRPTASLGSAQLGLPKWATEVLVTLAALGERRDSPAGADAAPDSRALRSGTATAAVAAGIADGGARVVSGLVCNTKEAGLIHKAEICLFPVVS